MNIAKLKQSNLSTLKPNAAIRLNPRAGFSQNKLLGALSENELMSWENNLEPVDLARGQVLYERAGAVKHIYFPTTAIVSLMCNTAQGGSCEIAMVGNDGAVGISILMGEDTIVHSAVALSEGLGFRMKASLIKSAFDQSKDVQLLMLRYMQSLITQVSQTAVSNRHYSIEQQLSRRLLMWQDRLAVSELLVTQEMLGNMLGVRRESVTEAAHKLQKAGLIRYSRGRVVIKDRIGLEKKCHEFYTSSHPNQVSERAMLRNFGAAAKSPYCSTMLGKEEIRSYG